MRALLRLIEFVLMFTSEVLLLLLNIVALGLSLSLLVVPPESLFIPLAYPITPVRRPGPTLQTPYTLLS